MNDRISWRRTLVRYLPFVGTLVGVVLVYLSVLPEDRFAVLGVKTVGVVFVLVGVWYAANPFLRTERRYLVLRQEVQRFIGLVRQLNHSAINPGSTRSLEHIKGEMHESVDRMARVAGREGATLE